MSKVYYNTVGVMSGTSLDGIDLAHIRFDIAADGNWNYQIGCATTIPYSQEWLNKLKSAIDFDTQQLQQLNQEYTLLLGTVIRDFIFKNKLEPLDAVCSHGHTILHQPQNGITLQIGNLPVIAQLTGQKVVCDFRVQDVKRGGQGAPLVPIGDRILFGAFDFCLNLGGFSNISFEHNQKRVAFDIAPVNTVLNFYAEKLGYAYDESGKIAASGNLHQPLFEALNALDYYQKPYPKSLGFEFVKTVVLPLTESYSCSIEDKLRTFCEHIAYQTATALQTFHPSEKKLFVTGGGAYNMFLLSRMQLYLPETQIIVPDPKTLEFKEALIFALLGVLRLRNEINVLSSVTGADEDHCSGVVY